MARLGAALVPGVKRKLVAVERADDDLAGVFKAVEHGKEAGGGWKGWPGFRA